MIPDHISAIGKAPLGLEDEVADPVLSTRPSREITMRISASESDGAEPREDLRHGGGEDELEEAFAAAIS